MHSMSMDTAVVLFAARANRTALISGTVYPVASVQRV